jgi:zinc transporter ZupT
MSVAPFILILIFILLGFSRVMALFGIVFAIGAGLLLLIVLLRLTTHTGRKTGDMPRENPFDQLQ